MTQARWKKLATPAAQRILNAIPDNAAWISRGDRQMIGNAQLVIVLNGDLRLPVPIDDGRFGADPFPHIRPRAGVPVRLPLVSEIDCELKRAPDPDRFLWHFMGTGCSVNAKALRDLLLVLPQSLGWADNILGSDRKVLSVTGRFGHGLLMDEEDTDYGK